MITLGRAGEDNKSFKLTDLDATLMSFAGADYSLQVTRLLLPLDARMRHVSCIRLLEVSGRLYRIGC